MTADSDDDDCPLGCDPAFVVQVSSDEDECRVCGRRGPMGDDE